MNQRMKAIYRIGFWMGLILQVCGILTVRAVAEEVLPLWPGTAPTGSDAPTPATDPTPARLTVFRAEHPNGAAVVICPGGGYGGLVTGAEGKGIAQWLNRHGISGVVLEYRLPQGRAKVPMLDAQRALRTVRYHAAEWGLDLHRIGIIGFSAGGHLASTAATHFDSGVPSATDPVEQMSCRPDFAILVYPVISMTDVGHGGSRKNLLGSNPTSEQLQFFSNEKQVTSQTCPTYLAHAIDDRVVSIENSRMFYQALKASKVAGQLLELPSGDHGLNGYKGPMWDAWQSGSLQWLASLGMIPEKDVKDAAPSPRASRFPSYRTLISGPQAVRLLPGQSEVVFTLYGSPGDLETVRSLVGVLKEQHLANGFDPGPGPGPGSNARSVFELLARERWPVVFYSGAEMQIKGGRAVFGVEQEASLQPMDEAGLFTAYQLGEWGYYFHNLSHNERWWRDVYGSEYEAYQHLKKPKGLAGYEKMPGSRKECYEILKDYFLSRSRDLLGRVISVTGHSHYEAYVGEWGARCIGLEVGENIAFTQSKFAFARGASRSWQKPWSAQMSPWFSGSCTTRGPLTKEPGGARGLDAGHSLSLYERMWLHTWFAGAAMVTPENSIAIFFDKPESPWSLTEHGKKASEVFQFMQSHLRGVPYCPIAIVLDRYAGYNGYMDKPWGILTPSAGDRELRDLFDSQLFPGSDSIHRKPDAVNPEASYLRPTPFGEVFDVLLTSAPPEVLPSYPVILLAGDIDFDVGFLSELEKALRRGSRVLLSPRHREALGNQFERLSKQGAVEVLEPWVNPETGRTTAISNERLQRLAGEFLPIRVKGEGVQYGVNRVPGGWVVELIHNRGVIKKPDQPVVIDTTAKVDVELEPQIPVERVVRWKSGTVEDGSRPIHVELGPGGMEYVEFLERRR